MTSPASPPLSARLFRRLAPGHRVPTTGLHGAARGYVLAQLLGKGGKVACITADDDAAEALALDLAFFLGGRGASTEPRVMYLPEDEVLPWDALAPRPALVAERMGVLFHLVRGHGRAVVMSARTAARRVLSPRVLGTLSDSVKVGEERDRDALARRLAELGYLSSPLVEDVGTFSVRGDLVDIFSPLYEQPVRLEFFGDTVESLRSFDPETQRTVAPLKTLLLAPARELVLNDATRRAAEACLRALGEAHDVPTLKLRERIQQLKEGLTVEGLGPLLPGLFDGGLGTVVDHLRTWGGGTLPLLFLDDPAGQERTLEAFEAEVERAHREYTQSGDLSLPVAAHVVPSTELQHLLAPFQSFEGGGLSFSDSADAPEPAGFGSTKALREAILGHHGEEGALTPLLERLTAWRGQKVAVAVACGSAGQADRLKRLLGERDVAVKVHKGALAESAELFDARVAAHLYAGEASEGFVDEAGGFALLADTDIFGARARRKARVRKSDNPFLSAFKDLEPGHLVVHKDFGIARYAGLTKMDVGGVPADFLVLEYAGRDKVYLPVSRMRLLQKFSGGDPTKVALDKLGSESWEKTKKRVKEQLLQVAAGLIRLYAARRAHPGHAFGKPNRYFRQFEADFEFDETEDQAKAIEQVVADMQSAVPMDRLVCGDVGYGKTEVAMRAAFLATLDHKQVAVLVPTTVLAQQHFLSFKKRFKDYPVNLDWVSGMRSTEENREVLRKAADGRVDVVVGTHKLLGKDVSFKDLGLVVVDEEQRFGVTQKEALKKLKTQVDVLTLTATPIPRTLNMALGGVRDLSLITTPPADRRAIRTFVQKFDTAKIAEALRQEVARGGQAFFVHNRVQSLASMHKLLKELCPELSIAVAHGQMAQGKLEQVMGEFVERKHQVLLCTAIIEAGIDIPSANTMIVNRADQFGLSQLYQLRGRVGRSRERAYAWLLVPPGRAVSKDAQRRLEVLQAFTELGAGFQVASQDLDIRGAGNLLGSEQSGAIEAIGFELYTQLLEESVAELKGEPLREEIEPDVTLPIPALIPDDYVPDVHQRLLLYKRFADATSHEALDELRAELVDRFGDVPDEVEHLAEVMRLKGDLRSLRLRGLDGGPGRLGVTLGNAPRVDAAKLARFVSRSGGTWRLSPDMKLSIKVPPLLKGPALLAEAKKVLADLARCAVE